MVNLSDITNVTLWSDYIQKTINISPFFLTVLVFALVIIFYIVRTFVKSYISAIGQKIGEKHADPLSNFISQTANLFKRIVFFIPNNVERVWNERRIGSLLNVQVDLLSNPDKKIRISANQKIINILSSSIGPNAAVKNKIHERLIKCLSSDFEDSRLYAIQNLSRIVEQTDKKRSVSPKLIEELINGIRSENMDIKNQSLALLRLIVSNNCGLLFIKSLENIHDYSILPILIDLLLNILEIEEKNDQIQSKIFSLLNGYLNSDNPETKKKALSVLEKRINTKQFAELALESELISTLLDLLLNDSLKPNAQQLLIKIGRMELLPQIMEVAKAKGETLPKKELSCLIYDTISSNNFNEILESGILEQIFSYLSQCEFYTRSCAGESIIRLIYLSDKSPKKSNLISKLRGLDLEYQILRLLSDSDSDIQMCGINLVQTLIRVNGYKEIVNEDIIKSLIRCFFTKSTDVNYRASQTLEGLIGFESIILQLCDLGCDERWCDSVAERFAVLLFHNKKDPIEKLIDDFELKLDLNKKIQFLRLKEKIADRLKKME
jgi:hypothetical protein